MSTDFSRDYGPDRSPGMHSFTRMSVRLAVGEVPARHPERVAHEEVTADLGGFLHRAG
jgi:hypothetical protein